MCGIAGVLAPAQQPAALAQDALLAMRESLLHRGPDDGGLWIDAHAGIALAHRRLAIVDLSAQGHQPMASASGRFQIVFNGEIYNHPELRAELGALPWRGHSDTETLLALFDRHGVRDSLPRLVGMFAIAVWDRQEQCLTLARDRMGEKPLYWGRLDDGSLAFASELRAIHAHPMARRRIDGNAVAQLLRYNCIAAPHSIDADIGKLEPGCWLELRAGAQPRHGRYWDLAGLAGAARSSEPMSDGEALERLDSLLMQSVRGQLLADVPVGAFLSGGVDSSAIVAAMVRASPRKVRTFCVGFEAGATNEAEHARAVAAHLGTDHTELTLTGADALALVPRLGTMFDEPFADSSQLPTHLVARMAREHVTVALSGDAGDELFAGYNRHAIAAGPWARLQRLPLPLRRAAANLLLALPPQGLDRLAILLQAARPPGRRHHDVGDKLHKLARQVLPAADTRELYQRLISHWPDPLPLLGTADRAEDPWLQRQDSCDWRDGVEAMQLADQLGYLPDDILVKVDRAAMAVSLETRAPLLDHRLVEFAWRLRPQQKIRDGQSKWLLRQLLYRQVPRELIERPKQGFAVPLDAWLRGPLREWADDLLEPAQLRADGLFEVGRIRSAWEAHQSGRANHQHRLWSVLMFQAWRRHSRMSPA